jgi:membrane protease YdiL (CAAX protease family)
VTPATGRLAEGTGWPRLLVGVGLVYALFHGVASALGSDRGQAGVVVGALVVAATLAAERLLFGELLANAARALGLGRPLERGLLVAAGLTLLLLLVFPAYALLTGARLGLLPGWAWLIPGLFAQGGVAEEVLFRGYLFRRVRRGRSFWGAVALSGAPFVAVHLVLFLTMPWPIALAALLLSAALSAPLAYLFELGGDTVWAPALVHFVVQGAIKIVTPEHADVRLPLAWMAASAAVPYLAFLVPRMARSRARSQR